MKDIVIRYRCPEPDCPHALSLPSPMAFADDQDRLAIAQVAVLYCMAHRREMAVLGIAAVERTELLVPTARGMLNLGANGGK